MIMNDSCETVHITKRLQRFEWTHITMNNIFNYMYIHYEYYSLEEYHLTFKIKCVFFNIVFFQFGTGKLVLSFVTIV